uniref:Uncharacterized protein n=1 Tax=Picea glauca TaxID=3330 RepID=A0A101M3T3_PICGL|nr:hypothetical protein ABT39_MTgene286 [Picea glauca]QHR90716.1 hypothetical protein Q903MT_gene4742 [Picea sitchensis]
MDSLAGLDCSNTLSAAASNTLAYSAAANPMASNPLIGDGLTALIDWAGH